jgi:serine/threonine protein kinase
MPSDSVASFFDHARASRLILPDQVDDLITQPDVPQGNLAAVCDFLRDRGVLTAYQSDLIRTGRLDELTFAGYPVVGELGPCPGGRAYRALHPSLRTPVVLRRIRPDWLESEDNTAAYVQQAQAAALVVHPHLTQLLDAGVFRGEPFVTLEPFDGKDLRSLVDDIGPMPVVLAAEYSRQAALALAAAHSRGLAHGGVHPGVMVVGPLVPLSKPREDGSLRFRPAPEAMLKVFELGLVPLSKMEPTPAGDVAGLGAAIHYLLTGREHSIDGPPLETLRPDLPTELMTLLREMTASDPADRPTAASVADRLAHLVSPPVQAKPPDSVIETGNNTGVQNGRLMEEPPAASPSGGWVAVPYLGPADTYVHEYTPPAYSEWPAEADGEAAWPPITDSDFRHHLVDTPPHPRPPLERSRRVWIWLVVGAGLQLLAILGWVYLFASPGCTNGTNELRDTELKNGDR